MKTIITSKDSSVFFNALISCDGLSLVVVIIVCVWFLFSLFRHVFFLRRYSRAQLLASDKIIVQAHLQIREKILK